MRATMMTIVNLTEVQPRHEDSEFNSAVKLERAGFEFGKVPLDGDIITCDLFNVASYLEEAHVTSNKRGNYSRRGALSPRILQNTSTSLNQMESRLHFIAKNATNLLVITIAV